jgi:hypothetical protein
MKKMLPILIIASIVSPMVFADGMFYVYDDDKDMWGLQPENRQLAAINYQGGFENMLVCVDVDDQIHGDKAVWIFPVPASPNRVIIDVLKGFPGFYGTDINREYRESVAPVGWISAGYSTFPISILFLMSGLDRSLSSALETMQDVIIHERIEKMGLTTELITTKSLESLNQYLQSKSLNLPVNSKTMLSEYIGKEYSLVISYISDLGQFKQESQKNNTDYSGYRGTRNKSGILIGVFVRFPTEKMYFPLKPTSIYGSQEVPIVLYVTGHVTPTLYGEITPKAEIAYYRSSDFPFSQELSSFFTGQSPIKNFKYTKIKINAPSKSFVQDLWIQNSAPFSLGIKTFLATYPWIWGILLYVGLSLIASILAGRISFRRTSSTDKPFPLKKLLLHGLWNCLTFYGFALATMTMKTKELDPATLQELRQKGLDVRVKDRRKILYVFLFYLFFLLLVGASVSLLLAMP